MEGMRGAAGLIFIPFYQLNKVNRTNEIIMNRKSDHDVKNIAMVIIKSLRFYAFYRISIGRVKHLYN